MAQITIREKDLTGNPASSTFDVAAVPGLTIKTQEELNKLGITYNTPIFVDSVSEFQEMFGDKPVQLTGAGIAYDYTEGVGITTEVAEDVEIASIQVTTEAYTITDRSFILSDDEDSGDVYLDGISKATFENFRTIDIESALTAQSIVSQGMQGTTAGYEVISRCDGQPILSRITYGGENHTLATVTLYPNPNCVVYGQGADPDPIPITDFFNAENNQNDSLLYPVTLSNMVAAVAPSTDGYFFGEDATGNRNLDPGYVYACELLYAGIPIYYIPVAGTTALGVYEAMEGQENVPSIFDQLRDRGTYNVKYLTSGGYPTFEYDNNKIAHIMLEVAGASNDQTDDYEDFDTDHLKITNGRGDCLALIDHFELDERNLLGAGSVWSRINKNYPTDPANPDPEKDEDICGLKGRKYLSYGAMYTPYAQYDLKKTYVIDDKEIIAEYLPASFAYMICLAKQLNGSLPSYEATAGVGRGTVANIHFNSKTNKYNLCTKEVLTNYIANYFNSPMKADRKDTISINALTQINPYGIVIWGDRTLLQKDKVLGIKATGIVSIRNMVSDIKKQMYQTARRYMFSANNDALWINFRNGVIGLLNQMQSGYGIESYTLSKDTEHSTKSALYVLCSIKPVYPVEKFDITIEITDDNVEVAETVNE